MERLKTRSHQDRALEWGLVLLFILVMSGVVLGRYEVLKERALDTIARYEYQLLETHLQVYRIRHGDWPPDLRTLARESSREVTLRSGNTRRQRLFNDQGRMLDPYGRPYGYAPDTGRLQRPPSLKK